MKAGKDRFSTHAEASTTFRPRYPDALFEFLFSLTPQKETASDCGTGNGQVAVKLAERFHLVYATDISKRQLSNAEVKANITYLVSRAERTTIPDGSVNLITVAQALHRFDLEGCYREVHCVAKPHAVIAVWGYNLLRISPEIHAVIDNFYSNTLAGYWDAERVHVENEYRTLPFPFRTLAVPTFTITAYWNDEQLIGYLNSWPAVQNVLREKGTNPVGLLKPRLQEHWSGTEMKDVRFPLFMNVGRI